MFISPENKGVGETMPGVEVKELALDAAVESVKKYKLYKQASETSNDLQFISKKVEEEERLRSLLPQAITELGEQIKNTETYNLNPSEEVAKLLTQKEEYEKLLLEIGEAPQKVQHTFDGAAFDNNINAFDNAQRLERTRSQGANGQSLEGK